MKYNLTLFFSQGGTAEDELDALVATGVTDLLSGIVGDVLDALDLVSRLFLALKEAK